MLINKKHTRDYILRRVKATRPGWECSRVSAATLERLDRAFTDRIDRMVRQHPTKGHTFREG